MRRNERVDVASDDFGKAKFLTNKFRVSALKSTINVHDFQLRDHFLNVNNLYTLRCECNNHKHNKERCVITDEKRCKRCGRTTAALITYDCLLYHGEQLSVASELYSCCAHTHKPPCMRCCNCRIVDASGRSPPCVISRREFECSYTNQLICPHHPDKFTRPRLQRGAMLTEHIYNTKMPIFYFCRVHAHYHKSHPNVVCHIQTFMCCLSAVSVREYTSSFVITINNITKSGENVECQQQQHQQQHHEHQQQQQEHQQQSQKHRRKRTQTRCSSTPGRKRRTRSVSDSSLRSDNGRIGAKMPNTQEYIIFDPSIWRDQSFNHFISFVRSVITAPFSARMRYARFENSNFTISNIKKYKSGKESVSRTTVTGFETKGIYQTSTISCTIPYYKVMIPVSLYKLLEEQHYDLDLVCVKRDPSIKPTCMYVCRAEINPNPEASTIVIPDALTIGLNQDQDGDKNAIYLLPTRHENYDRRSSYQYNLAKFELTDAYRRMITLIAQPRYFISETNLLHLQRRRDEFADLLFAARTIDRGHRYVRYYP